MTYSEFKDELMEQIVRKSEWGLSSDNVRFYDDGFTASDNKEDQEFIRNTNIRYHKTESDAPNTYSLRFLLPDFSHFPSLSKAVPFTFLLKLRTSQV